MDWIKIKSEHISSDYTDTQVGALIRYQLLVAKLKRLPRDSEIKRELNYKVLAIVQRKLQESDGKLLEDVGKKVLEDVQTIEERKTYEKDRKRNYRAKQDVSRGTEGDSPIVDKRREEKRREEKKRTATKLPWYSKIEKKDNEYKTVILELMKEDYQSAKALHKIIVEEMIPYYREKKEKGKKEKWEMEKTFEYKSRIRTWIRKGHKFQKDYQCSEKMWHKSGEKCYCKKKVEKQRVEIKGRVVKISNEMSV